MENRNDEINQDPTTHIRTALQLAIDAIFRVCDLFDECALRPSQLIAALPEFREFEMARRGLDKLDLDLAIFTEKHDLGRLVGSSHPEQFLIESLHLPRRVALQRMKVAAFLNANPQTREAALPRVRQGHLSLFDVVSLHRELGHLHHDATASADQIGRAAIADTHAVNQGSITKVARKLVRNANRMTPTCPDPSYQSRKLHIGDQDRDGGAHIRGYLDAATLVLFQSWLTQHSYKGQSSRTDAAAETAPKLITQANVDALRKALEIASTVQPRVAGKPQCTLVVKLSPQEIRSAIGADNGEQHPSRVRAKTTGGLELGLSDLLRLGLGNDVYAAAIDASAPTFDSKLRLGRTRRSASFEQRIALALFDGTCQHPGCNVSADACDAHHIQAWSQGGETNAENLTLLCRRHHTDNDDSRMNPRRGHMSDRSADTYGRSHWNTPLRSFQAEATKQDGELITC